MPKPVNFIFDPNSPIYRKGDENQAGEMGRPVIVNVSVSFEFKFFIVEIKSYLLLELYIWHLIWFRFICRISI